MREVDFPTFEDAEFKFDPLTERDARDGVDLIIKIRDDRDRVVFETTVSLEKLAGGVNRKMLRLDSAGAVVRINARFDDGGRRGGSAKKSVGFASEVSTWTSLKHCKVVVELSADPPPPALPIPQFAFAISM